MTRHLAAQHEAYTAAQIAVERAAAVMTVAYFGTDAIWMAPTRQGAEYRASRCLSRGADPAEVVDALTRWDWSA